MDTRQTQQHVDFVRATINAELRVRAGALNLERRELATLTALIELSTADPDSHELVCALPIAKIAQRLKMVTSGELAGEDTVTRALQDLVDRGLLVRRLQPGRSHHHTLIRSKLYPSSPLPPDDWLPVGVGADPPVTTRRNPAQPGATRRNPALEPGGKSAGSLVDWEGSEESVLVPRAAWEHVLGRLAQIEATLKIRGIPSGFEAGGSEASEVPRGRGGDLEPGGGNPVQIPPTHHRVSFPHDHEMNEEFIHSFHDHDARSVTLRQVLQTTGRRGSALHTEPDEIATAAGGIAIFRRYAGEAVIEDTLEVWLDLNAYLNALRRRWKGNPQPGENRIKNPGSFLREGLTRTAPGTSGQPLWKAAIRPIDREWVAQNKQRLAAVYESIRPSPSQP